jgi:hypothetical protein
MIDYLLCFPDEATAHAVLDPLGYGYPAVPEDFMPARWDESRCLKISLSVGMRQVGVDENNQPIMAPAIDPRFWLAIALPAPDNTLYSIPACMREADRDIALANLEHRRLYPAALEGAAALRAYGVEIEDPAAPVDRNYVLRERFTPEQLANPWQLFPQWAGVDYSNPGVTA